MLPDSSVAGIPSIVQPTVAGYLLIRQGHPTRLFEVLTLATLVTPGLVSKTIASRQCLCP